MTPEEARAEALRRQAMARQQALRASNPSSDRRRTWGEWFKDEILPDDNPDQHNLGERTAAAINKAGEAMTFGLIGDEASAAVESLLPGVNYDDRLEHYRQQERVLERDNPALAFGAELGGGVLGALIPGVGLVGTGARGAGAVNAVGGAIRAANTAGTLGPAAGMGTRMLAGALAGGAGAGTYGFMEGEGGLGERVASAGDAAPWGVGFGMAAPVLGAAAKGLGDEVVAMGPLRAARRSAPSADALRAEGRAAYQAIDDMGAQVRPEAWQRFISETDAILPEVSGYDRLPGPGSLTPKTARVMQVGNEMVNQMAPEPTAALPFREIDQFRRKAGVAAADMSNGRSTPDGQAGTQIVTRLDGFVNNLRPEDMVEGDPAALQSAITKAREIWGRMSRAQLLEDAIDNSESYVSGGASGIRNQFARILRNPKLRRGFSEDELTVMRRVAQGTIPERILYNISGGLGQLSLTGLGAGLGSAAGPVGTVVGGAAGAGAASGLSRLAGMLASRNAEAARGLVAGGRLNAGLPRSSEANRQIVEALMRRVGAAGGQQ
ncbi:MAG: hypothetical protein N4A39_10225 [Roseicyclus sp.]|jgi:hypothetical protein|nr:hypothetical protein [Roseicyclus sp.]